jgi:ABC-2 type transport system permease protein
MLRYLRLFKSFVVFSFKKALVFKWDFGFRIVMDCFYYLQNFIFYYLVFQKTDNVGGWTIDQAWIFVASFCLVDALNMTLFANNVWWMAPAINKGDLDYYLVRPVNSLFFLSLREFAVNSFVNLLIAFGLFIWAIARYPGDLGFFQMGLLIFLLLNGCVLHYVMHTICVLPVFWIQGSRGFEDIYWSMSRAMERPDKIFKGWVWKLFSIFLPYSLMASVPVRLVLGEFDYGLFGLLVAVSILFFMFFIWLWNRGLRVYGSASS